MGKLTASISTLYALCFTFVESETWVIEIIRNLTFEINE